jgi:hypothetical protein
MTASLDGPSIRQFKNVQRRPHRSLPFNSGQVAAAGPNPQPLKFPDLLPQIEVGLLPCMGNSRQRASPAAFFLLVCSVLVACRSALLTLVQLLDGPRATSRWRLHQPFAHIRQLHGKRIVAMLLSEHRDAWESVDPDERQSMAT